MKQINVNMFKRQLEETTIVRAWHYRRDRDELDDDGGGGGDRLDGRRDDDDRDGGDDP